MGTNNENSDVDVWVQDGNLHIQDSDHRTAAPVEVITETLYGDIPRCVRCGAPDDIARLSSMLEDQAIITAKIRLELVKAKGVINLLRQDVADPKVD